MHIPNFTTYLLCVADIAIILPAALICLFPVRRWFKFSAKKMFAITLGVTIPFCLLVPLFGCGTVYNTNTFLLPFVGIAFAFYFSVVRLEKQKLLYIFLCATASMSIGGLLNYLVVDFRHPFAADALYPSGLAAEWILILLLLLFYRAFTGQLEWMLDNFHPWPLWLLFCVIPAVVTVLNIMMIPQHPELMREGRLFQMSLMLEGLLLAFFLFYQVMFYVIAQAVSDRFEKEKLSQLLEAQSAQYQSMQSHMEQTRRIRHDQRQVIRTVRSLLAEKQYEELDRFTKKYEQDIQSLSAPEYFCPHVSLNAALGYYANLAKQHAISTVWQIDLPEDLAISDVEICILFGNLLENALNACLELPESERYIHLSADRTQMGMYIVMINSCTDQYSSASEKPAPAYPLLPQNFRDDHGIGLTSVRTTAEKYGGTAEFQTKGKEFHSRVMLKV